MVEALRDDDLEDVAVADVLLRPLDGGAIRLGLDARDRRRRHGQIHLGEPGLGGLRELVLQLVEAPLRGRPQGLRVVGAVVERRDDEDRGPVRWSSTTSSETKLSAWPGTA